MRGQAAAVFVQRPAKSLQARVGALFKAPHPVDRGRCIGNDVELVDSDPCIGQLACHADGDGISVLIFGEEHDAAFLGIGHDGQVILAAPLPSPDLPSARQGGVRPSRMLRGGLRPSFTAERRLAEEKAWGRRDGLFDRT